MTGSSLPLPVDEVADPGPPLPLFAHGAVLPEELLSNLLERPAPGEAAVLTGFVVAELGGTGWPVLVPARPGETRSEVHGRLYRGLSEDDMARVDAYQGVGEELYRRARVAVRSSLGQEPAIAYLPTDKTLRTWTSRR